MGKKKDKQVNLHLKRLSEKEKNLCDYYIENVCTFKEAALAVGYSKSYAEKANTIFSKPLVKNYIQERKYWLNEKQKAAKKRILKKIETEEDEIDIDLTRIDDIRYLLSCPQAFQRLTFKNKQKVLWWILTLCVPKESESHVGCDMNNAIKCLEMLAKMDGDYSPERHTFSHMFKIEEETKRVEGVIKRIVDENRKDY